MGDEATASPQPRGVGALPGNDREAFVAVLCVCGFAASLRILGFYGFVGSDDVVYAMMADALAHGDYPWTGYEGPPVFPVRLGLIAPVALLIESFGTSETVFLVYPFATSVLGVLLTFAVGRHFFGNLAGLIAAVLASVLPIDLMMATHLTPDPSGAFWTNLGTLLVLLAIARDRHRMAALGLAAGLCFGIAWLHKVNVVYQAPLIAGFLLWSARSRRECWAAFSGVALGAVLVVGAEAIFYSSVAGDFLHRFHSLERNFEHTKIYWFVEGGKHGWQPGEYWSALANRLFVDGPSKILFRSDFGFLPLLGLIGIAFGVWIRDRRYVFCSAWLLLLILLFNFGTTSLDYYRPLILYKRYPYPMLLPSMVLVGATISILFEGRVPGREPIRPAPYPLAWAWVAICAALLAQPVAKQLGRGTTSQTVRAAADVVSSSDKVYTDFRTVTELKFFMGFPKHARIEPFESLTPKDIEAGALVFVNRARLGMMKSAYGVEPPAFLQRIPPHWVREASLPGGAIYRATRLPRVGRQGED